MAVFSGVNLDVWLAVPSRQASKLSLVEERRKEDRRKSYGHRYLAMLIGVLPEDRRQVDRRRQAATTASRADSVAPEATHDEENAAS